MAPVPRARSQRKVRQESVLSGASAVSSNIGLAVALFERGFAEDRVEDALQHCRTLEEALRWLSPTTRGGSSNNSSSTKPSMKVAEKAGRSSSCELPAALESASVPLTEAHDFKVGDKVEALYRRTPKGVTARWFGAVVTSVDGDGLFTISWDDGDPKSRSKQAHELRKQASSEQKGTRVDAPDAVGDAAAASSVARSRSPLASRSLITTDTARSVASSTELPAGAMASSNDFPANRKELAAPIATRSRSAPSSGAGVPIEPREDSAQWWRDAASRWPSIVDSVRASCAERMAVADQNSLCVSAGSPPAAFKRKRPSVDEGGVADMDKRPPATPQPCTEGSSAAAAASSSDPQRRGGRRVSTPGQSPRAMTLNSTSEELCEICCHDVPICRAVRLACGHGWYCAQCVVRHAEARLSVGAANVTCPECNVVLPERVLRKLLPAEIIDRLLQRSLDQAVSALVDLRACPTPNCPMRVALEDDGPARLKCTECKRESCLRCGAQPFHKGMTCEEHAEHARAKAASARGKKQRQERERIEGEESLMQWLKETGSKQCPTCKMAVTKQNLNNQATQYSECHKMMCRSCNTKFCFKCLAVLTDTYACKCTRVDHGFVDPRTGKRLEHLKAEASTSKQRGRPPNK